MIMSPLVFGERYTRFTFWFALPLEWRCAVLVNATDTLVAGVGNSGSASFEMHPGILE
jgi:hypothetical protein